MTHKRSFELTCNLGKPGSNLTPNSKLYAGERIIMKKLFRMNFWFAMMVIAVCGFGAGCAITDYDGIAAHNTSAEAKLWGIEISFTGTGDPLLDGTYIYTVKYSRANNPLDPVTITSYRNPVPSSFSRDGLVDRDGDDVQGRGGVLGGKNNVAYVSIDKTIGNCEFFDNITQTKTSPAAIALCDTVEEEIDKDLELQASFSSWDDMINQIWAGTLQGKFNLMLASFDVNGLNVPLTNHFKIESNANGFRPATVRIGVNTTAGKELINAILNNTQNKQPVSLKLNFEGGMSIALPSGFKVAFNHDVLLKMVT
jgi:hypothetical protein